MKKTKFISLVLALLMTASGVGTYTAVADGKPGKPAGTESTDSTGAPEQQLPVSLADSVQQWKKYVSFGEEEPMTKAYTAQDVTQLWGETNGNQITMDSSNQNQGYLFTATKTETTKLDETAVDPALAEVLVEERTVISWYNAETLEKVKDFTQVKVEFNGTIDADYQKDQQVEYTYYVQNGILFVTQTTYEAIPETEPVEYQAVSKRAVFTKDGTQLNGEWSDETEVSWNYPGNAPQHVELTVDETVYVLKDGDIIATFAKGLQHDLPCYDNAGGTVLTQGDYTYFIDELPMQPIGVTGDLVLVVFPGVSLQVMDKNHNAVATYETEGESIMGYGVLDNGNVVISQLDYVHEDATDFDFKNDDAKVKIKNVIVSVADGSVTELQDKFILSNVLTNATKDIATPMHQNTMSNVAGHAQIKEGVFLAEVQKVVDGELSREKTFVVMKNDGTLETELPQLNPSQFGYMGFFNKETPIFATTTVGNLLRFYTVDAYGKASLFFNMANNDVRNIKQITDEIIVYKDAIYTIDGKKAYDLSTVASYEVYEDTVLVSEYGYGYTIVTEKVGDDYWDDSLVDTNSFYTNGNDIAFDEEAGVYKLSSSMDSFVGIANKYGEIVIEESMEYRYGYVEDAQGRIVTYDMQVELVDYYVFGDTIMVHCHKSYEETDTYYGEGGYELPNDTDVYYVLK